MIKKKSMKRLMAFVITITFILTFFTISSFGLETEEIKETEQVPVKVESCKDIIVKKEDGNWLTFKDEEPVDYTGVAFNSYGWWKVTDGKVDFSYNGYEKNDYGLWNIKNGKVDFSANGVIKDKKTNNWYLTNGGKVNEAIDTIAPNSYGWWKINDGKVDFHYHGYADNEYGKWNIKNGKVDFSASGVLKDKKTGNWYLTNGGKVNDTANTIAPNAYGWWHIKNGKVDFSSNTVAKNTYGWWHVKNGKVDFSSNTIAPNAYGWWHVKNGKVDFSSNTIAPNAYGWWHIKNGKVDFSSNTVAKNNYGWWKIKNGKVDFNFNGIASNSNGNWYIRNGKVDFGFSGYAYGYEVKNGRAYAVPYVMDVSQHQGNIDFGKTKKSGLKGVMIRSSHSDYEGNKLNEKKTKDKQFEYNTKECEKRNIPYGTYHFAGWHIGDVDRNEAIKRADQEADMVIRLLKGKKIKGYVALDVEDEFEKDTGKSKKSSKLTKSDMTYISNRFMDKLAAAGYKPVLYTSISPLYDWFDYNNLKYPFWIACYCSPNGIGKFPNNGWGQRMENIKDRIVMWQFTNKKQGKPFGVVDIYGAHDSKGNPVVDMSYLYRTFGE